MNTVLYVALGGAFGAAGRYLVMSQVGRWLGPTTVLATPAVNILGSFLLGALVGYAAQSATVGLELRAFLFVGVLGGFTTFSAFSLDAVILIERGQTAEAVLYALGSMLLSVAGLLAGLRLLRWVLA